MRVLLQRVNEASVHIDGNCAGAIGRGLLLLVGFGTDDSEAVCAPMVDKISTLRVFPDERGRFDRSVRDVEGGVLLVPQFTLYGDASKGRRPGFSHALAPAQASKLFDHFVTLFRKCGIPQVETGVFGAMMQVSLVNDGPVTLMIELP